jgi:hypothetical protein
MRRFQSNGRGDSNMSILGPTTSQPKPRWRTPKLEELGNVRDFVRSTGSQANGKSHVGADGSNTEGGAAEQMN